MSVSDSNVKSTSDSFKTGQIYASMQVLTNEVAQYFAKRNLAFRLPVNTKKLLEVTCTEHRDCPFVVWTFQVRDAEAVWIAKVEDEHNITHVDFESERKRAPNRVRGKLLVSVAQSVLQVADVDVWSTQIKRKAKIDHQFKATQYQAWRAKREVLDESREDGKQSYMFMKDWILMMDALNPGLATRFETTGTHFKRAGIAHGAFNQAFESMLPVVALDACHLKTKDKGVLSLAPALTGDFDNL